MKKKIMIAVMLCLAVAVAIVAKMGVDAYSAKKRSEQDAYEARNEAKDYTYTLEKCDSYGYWNEKLTQDDIMRSQEIMLIKTYEECQQLKTEIKENHESRLNDMEYEGWGGGDLAFIDKIEKYDETFFRGKDLIIGYYYLGSSSTVLEFKRLDVVDGVGSVVTQRTTPYTANDMIDQRLLLIEVSKDNGITSVDSVSKSKVSGE